MSIEGVKRFFDRVWWKLQNAHSCHDKDIFCTVENVIVESASFKVAWLKQVIVIKLYESRNLLWRWVNNNIFYHVFAMKKEWSYCIGDWKVVLSAFGRSAYRLKIKPLLLWTYIQEQRNNTLGFKDWKYFKNILLIQFLGKNVYFVWIFKKLWANKNKISHTTFHVPQNYVLFLGVVKDAISVFISFVSS